MLEVGLSKTEKGKDMTNKLLALSALAFTLTSIQSPIVVAQGAMHQENCVLNAAEKLDLNAEQKLKIKLFAHKAQIDITLKRHELHTIRKHIHETFHSGNMNIVKIDEFAKQQERVYGSIVKLRLYERYKIYQALNAKQREKMDLIFGECLENHPHK